MHPLKIWLSCLLLSLGMHFVGGWSFLAKKPTRSSVYPKIALRVIEKSKEPVTVSEELLPERPKQNSQADATKKPEPKPKVKPAKTTARSERTPKTKAKKPVKPVQGLSASAFSDGVGAVAAPVGNTLMQADEGLRLQPGQVEEALEQDLSQEARLLRASVKEPVYTDEAIDAGLEGTFVVEVFVDEQGHVVDAELSAPIGLGMDERVLAAARKAHFEPRRDQKGKALSGWSRITFRLEID